MTSRSTSLVRRTLLGCALATLTFSACGGSDAPSGNTDGSVQPAADADTSAITDDTTAISDGAATEQSSSGDSPIQIGDDGDIAFSDEVDEALDSVGFDTIMGVVAGQLDPEPSVEVNGSTATFTFDEGSVDSSWLPCSVAGAFIEDGQTVTVVYPDGSTDC